MVKSGIIYGTVWVRLTKLFVKQSAMFIHVFRLLRKNVKMCIMKVQLNAFIPVFINNMQNNIKTWSLYTHGPHSSNYCF